ncbi:MAG: aldehyde dehydrogenase family protein [Rhodococcus sp. (in: high G+C Gram-positive bacteria)]|uniref:aldehyde dehydrogenase family protein n=1 Tax=Rhodococcus sp. TaxID=1831 RepID=UPI003BAEF86F
MAKLRGVYAGGRTRDVSWRIRQLRGIERLVEEREGEIAAALDADLGRSAAEAWLGDIASTKGEAVYARKKLRKWMRRRFQPMPLNQFPSLGWVQHEPLGVVLIIAPWNYPVYLALSPLVAAVAAGNCAVVKPSELAPATAALLARLIPEYLDKDAIAVVEGDGMVTQDLLAQGFDHALFTGGTEVGKKIMAGAAPHLTPVTLELGGKSPVIVTKDADLEITARRIAWTKLLNSGQTCIAPDYVLVEASVKDELVRRIIDTVTKFRSEAPNTGMRVVNARQFERLIGYIADTSGEIVTGGDFDAASLTIQPTVIVDPSPTDSVMQDEVFGPLLPILAIDSLDAAIEFVNARPKPLATYIFTRSGAAKRRLLTEISSGGAVVNHIAMHCLVPQLPFGGVGASGMGAYHGRWGFEALSHRKAVLSKTFKPDLQLIYPPYTDKALALMRKVF